MLTDVLPEGLKGLLIEAYPTVQPDLFHGLGDGKVQMTTQMLVPRSVRRAARSLVIFHESAHHVFNTIGRPHTHGEVWRLTLALAFPRWVVREAWHQAKKAVDRVMALAALGAVPAWCAAARLEVRPRKKRASSRPIDLTSSVRTSATLVVLEPAHASYGDDRERDDSDDLDVSQLLPELASPEGFEGLERDDDVGESEVLEDAVRGRHRTTNSTR